MPHDKYVNHKGRCRQFTSSYQLQKDLEDQAVDLKKLEQSEQSENDDERAPAKNSVKRIHNIFKISNPNRLQRDKQDVNKDNAWDDPKPDKGLRNRQTQEDLERLSIVRREREAAAKRRLAAKKAAAEADALRLMSSLKKITKQSAV